MALIGYARVSTRDQDSGLQISALKAAGCAKIFSETASGAKRDRPELMKALDYMRKGDVLVVWKLDRLARSVIQLADTLAMLMAEGIGFQSVTQGIDTTSAAGRLQYNMLAAVAEFERELISERTTAGLDEAKAKRKRLGRKPSMSEDDVNVARALLASDFTATAVA
jgi:DNA invertase Pin-like site-specific DNA recombinase